MHNLIEVQVNAYIRENCQEKRKIKGMLDLDKSEMESLKKKYNRYLNEITEALEIKSEMYRLKNKKKEYCFTDDGAKLLEEVFCLYHLSKTKDDRLGSKTLNLQSGKTEKNLATLIFVYKKYDAFVSNDVLTVYEDFIEVNNLVVKVIECFYKLFQDAGVPENEIRKIMSKAGRNLRYSERKCYLEVFKQMSNYTKKLLEIDMEDTEININKTENVIWMDYVAEQLEEKMKELFQVREEMKEIRKCELEELTGSVYEVTKPESIELYKEQEEKITLRCIGDTKIQDSLREYKRYFQKELDIAEVVKAILIGTVSELDEMDAAYFKQDLRRLLDTKEIYKKASVRKKEEILDKITERILEIAHSYKYENIFAKEGQIKIRNEELLNSAIISYKEKNDACKKIALETNKINPAKIDLDFFSKNIRPILKI